jgi:hypothetical protein
MDGYPVYIKKVTGTVELRYHGTIEKRVMHTNCITEEWTEISSISALYPVSKYNDQIKGFQLSLSLPCSYSVITNGELCSSQIKGGRCISKYKNNGSESEILIVASKYFHQIKNAIGLSVYYCNENLENISVTRIKQVENMLSLYGNIFGKLHTTPELKYIIAHRNGFGYTAGSCIVVSEQRETAENEDCFNIEYMLSHELAHYYWHLVNDYDTDGWIDEGLSEYSSLVYFYKTRDEEKFLEIFERYYFRNVEASRSNNSVITTSKNSIDKHANWYSKPACAIFAIGKGYGFPMVNEFLSNLYQEFHNHKVIDAKIFLDRAHLHLSTDAYKLLTMLLVNHGWGTMEKDIVKECIIGKGR